MREHSTVAVHSSDSLEDRPLTELVSGLGKDLGLLVRQEIQLAKAEITDKVSRVTKGATTIGVGAFIAYAGVLAMTAALVLVAISVGIAPWLSALLIGVLLLVGGYGAIQSGRRSMTAGPAPLQRTRQTTKETVHHLKEQLQ